MRKIEITPQPGFQQRFATTPADIAIGGGAAGCGKSFVELLEPLRHIKTRDFGAVIFRRTYPQITVEGGLWDEASNMYPHCGGFPNQNEMEYNFLSGAKVSFRHMQNPSVLLQYQGAQIPLIEWDELTHFTLKEFIYMLTRNRSGCGVRPYMRATCNPDPDSFVATLIEWYIDQESGYPIPERAGVLRYFVCDQNNFIWGNTKKEVFEKSEHLFKSDAIVQAGLEPNEMIKSFTFIPGSIFENKKLLEKDKAYIGNLLAQDEDTQLRLLHGNWKIRTDNQNLFNFLRLSDLFTNVIPKDPKDQKYITIDHAREGQDLCVICLWEGWRCIRMDLLPKSDTNDILRVI